jgi:hypothetical protein
MTYTGKVKGGVVVIEGDVKLPDGAMVQVSLLDYGADDHGPSLLESLESVVGKAKGLPADAARSIDRDLYGVDRP